jgi:hypothetical protein
VEGLADKIPKEHWGQRMDVLSVEEALQAVGAIEEGGLPPRAAELPDKAALTHTQRRRRGRR